ncbi:endonuclease/exonuclease/phosphatase family protein [uncultured Psychroserpens sp.]|uniref:endonuclease/exonuclease/phosphatase family protein n=1 Tax=uncultured Psychroserpens sp. TaxID=255436 RepID=UPI00261508AE|nr:endonuclease/exonuclease/phosphatase family protein [uncultured Psychroserpens sp.]
MHLKLKQHYKAYLLVGYAFLLLIHFIAKDHVFPLSIVFYAFPLPILIVIGLCLTGLFFRRLSYALPTLALTVLLVIIWKTNYYFSTEKVYRQNSSKVLFWNLAKRAQLPVDQISDKVKTHQPEILSFVEAPHTTLKNLDDLKLALPNYNFKTLKGAMLVAAKGDIELLKHEYKDDSHKINMVQISNNSKHLKIIITDLTASVFINKKQPVNIVLGIAKANAVDFIAGDFNTPYESVFFKEYKTNYNSFHNYNNGFTATWPLGIPLFEIDHIWISKQHEPIRLNKYYNDASDHALLISEFEIH